MARQNTAIYQKIAEKRANLELLREFKTLTDELANELESIGDRLETVRDGTSSVALILSNWQRIIQSISLASLCLLKSTNGPSVDRDAYPEPLIRINLNESDNNEQEEIVDEEQQEENSEESGGAS
ncbi:DAD2 [Candida theae]|uniref:DASH complex subunit DAD2 n=1 Tax=Candida theae TaxID=1198502 RepID=A0AAD5BCN6_9ASCO|nr:DAD2 [Candida theae]KAI5952977.1 DAD2 [Candida theae]